MTISECSAPKGMCPAHGCARRDSMRQMAQTAAVPFHPTIDRNCSANRLWSIFQFGNGAMPKCNFQIDQTVSCAATVCNWHIFNSEKTKRLQMQNINVD